MFDYEVPKRLYKFKPKLDFTSKRYPDFLENGLLRMTPPSEFNDPFECIYRISNIPNVAENIIEKFVSDGGVEEAYNNAKKESYEGLLELGLNRHKRRLAKKTIKQNQFRNKIISNAKKRAASYKDRVEKIVESKNSNLINNRDSAGILCLTEDVLNPTMWAHYSSEGKGYAIELDTSINIFKHDFQKIEKLYSPHKVTYSESKLVELNENSISGYSPIFWKHSSWAYESEWRIVGDYNEINQHKESLGKGLVAINPNSVVSIVLGYNLDENETNKIVSTIQSGIFKKAVIKKIVPNLEKVELELVDLEI